MSESGGLQFGNKGRVTALCRGVEIAELPAQREVELSEFLALAGGWRGRKKDFQHVYPFQ